MYSIIYNKKINFKNKKKIHINLVMSLKSVKNLEDIIYNQDISNKEQLYNILKDKLKNEHNIKWLSIAENNTLKKEIENVLNKKNKLNEQNYNKSFNINKSNEITSIRITDHEFNCVYVYVGENTIEDSYVLYNENSKKVGVMRHWIDDDDEIPKEFKTSDGIVLDPTNNQKITEIEITPGGGLFLGINPNIYREYEYDEDLEFFRITNCIQKA